MSNSKAKFQLKEEEEEEEEEKGQVSKKAPQQIRDTRDLQWPNRH